MTPSFRLLALATALGVTCMSAAAVEPLVTPGSSGRAQALLNYLASLQGRKIISGQLEGDAIPGREAPFDRILRLTGKYPGIRGFDMAGYGADLSEPNVGVTGRAIEWSAGNGIVHLTWHWNMKGSDGAVEVYATPRYKGHRVTDFDISKAVTPGTPEHVRFRNDIERVATELKHLQDAGVPVLWRPFHECSSPTFWWGAKGPEPLKKAWKMMFEQLVGEHGLRNLIWVFTPTHGAALPAWYPGDEYVDVISFDGYTPQGAYPHPTFADEYASMKRFAQDLKLVTMTENGGIPDVSQLAAQGANWVTFMTWDDEYAYSQDWNSDAFLVSTYASDYVLTRDELPKLASLPVPAQGFPWMLKFTRQPSRAYLGDSWLSPVYAGVVDLAGRVVRTAKGTVTFRYGGLSQQAKLVNGVARFAPVFTANATAQTVSVEMPWFFSKTSDSFDVGTAADPAQFNFESDAQGWIGTGSVAQTGLRAHAGTRSLAMPLTGLTPAANSEVIFAPGAERPGPGATVRARVWIPAGSNVHGLFAYVQEEYNEKTKDWRFTDGAWFDRAQVVSGTWNTVTVTVPSDQESRPVYKLGVRMVADSYEVLENGESVKKYKELQGTAYVDSVSW